MTEKTIDGIFKARSPHHVRKDGDISERIEVTSSVPYVLPNGKIDWSAALADNEKWMRSTIARRVGEQSAVDEVFQDVALAATKQKSPLRDVTKVVAWLYRLVIVQSSLYRRMLGRKRKLIRRCEDKVETCEIDVNQYDPLEWLLLKERKGLVQKALVRLHQDERKILFLKYAEDKSYHEIAEELGVSVSAVQSKLHRARLKLKSLLRSFVTESTT